MSTLRFFAARTELDAMSLLKTQSAPAHPAFSAIAMRPDAWDRDTFWRFADNAKEATEALAAEKMKVLPQLPIEALRRFCTQYRFFTIDYISDLALLLAKLPFGGLRSLLSEILAEELGEGDPAKAHPEIYDRFLASIGVAPRELDRALPENHVVLGGLTEELRERDAAFGVGLRGMGGECLCQTYLSVMFEHMRAHPYLRENADRIDWEFWTIHTGEADIVHGELTRRAIDDYLRRDPSVLPELAEGYERSITAWNLFWQNIFDAYAPQPRAVS
ncbi:iron-containing redox enzyme family protein [Luteimonas gilva]|nr:iron-containing redox enzyme family protein [Luteimonas gilva]